MQHLQNRKPQHSTLPKSVQAEKNVLLWEIHGIRPGMMIISVKIEVNKSVNKERKKVKKRVISRGHLCQSPTVHRVLESTQSGQVDPLNSVRTAGNQNAAYSHGKVWPSLPSLSRWGPPPRRNSYCIHTEHCAQPPSSRCPVRVDQCPLAEPPQQSPLYSSPPS